MALDDLEDWVRRADAAARAALEGFERAYGYPPEANEVLMVTGDPASGSPWPASDLERFFSVVDELSWPDVWNGYFVGPGREMLRRFTAGELTRLEVQQGRRTVFPLGSDGGGAHFVVALDDGVVVRVSDAVVAGGVLTGTSRVVARDLDGFLEGLVRNAELFAAGAAPHF